MSRIFALAVSALLVCSSAFAAEPNPLTSAPDTPFTSAAQLEWVQFNDGEAMFMGDTGRKLDRFYDGTITYQGEALDNNGKWNYHDVVIPVGNVSFSSGGELHMYTRDAMPENVELRSGGHINLEVDDIPTAITNLFVGAGSSFSADTIKAFYNEHNDVKAQALKVTNLSFTDSEGKHGTLNINGTMVGDSLKFNQQQVVDSDEIITVQLAENIDLTGANIAVSLLGLELGLTDLLGEGGTLDLKTLFGDSKLYNERSMGSLSFQFGEDDTVVAIAGGALQSGWSWVDGQQVLQYSNGDSAAAPEPATLALFGLGLAGLAVVRRRRK